MHFDSREHFWTFCKPLKSGLFDVAEAASRWRENCSLVVYKVY